MDPAPLKRRRGYILMAAGASAVMGMLLMLGYSVETSAQYGLWRYWILALNAAGVLVMTWLLTRRVLRLVRDYRNHVPGSRLTARTVIIFGTLVVVPLLVMYLFWLGFLNRGINSWFKENLREPLQQSVMASSRYLELVGGEHRQRTAQFASRLGGQSGAALTAALAEGRAVTGARELVAYGADGQVIATSSETREAMPPVELPPDLLQQVGARNRIRTSISSSPPATWCSCRGAHKAAGGAVRPLPGAKQLAPRELSEMVNADGWHSTTTSPWPFAQPLKTRSCSPDAGAAAVVLSANIIAIRWHTSSRVRARPHPGHARVGKGDFGNGWRCLA